MATVLCCYIVGVTISTFWMAYFDIFDVLLPIHVRTFALCTVCLVMTTVIEAIAGSLTL